MAITRRQLSKTATYILEVGNYYEGMPKGTLVRLIYDDSSVMPGFRMVSPVSGVDPDRWIDLLHLSKYDDPTTVAVPIAVAQAFIDCHYVDGRSHPRGSRHQCEALRAALVKALPMAPELVEAKARLEAAGYKVEKAS